MSRGERIVLGEVVKPHGVKGEVRIVSHADSPSLFSELPRLCLELGGKQRPCEVLSWRPTTGQLILRLKGIEDRDQAIALRGAKITCPAEDLPEPEEGVYCHELIGLAVFTRGPDGPVALGLLEAIIEVPAQELWSIRDAQEREILMPARPEFVLDIDLQNGRIVIDPPPGLLEIYQEESKASQVSED